MKKLSEYPPFPGQELLLLAQARGKSLCPEEKDFAALTLVGLVDLLVEHDIGGASRIASGDQAKDKNDKR
jgi:hypothetical protein